MKIKPIKLTGKAAKKYICVARKVYHDYEVLDTVSAGIVLHGTEIKSIRNHLVSIDGSYARVDNGQVVLINCDIQPCKGQIVDSKRNKVLLLKKQEIRSFAEHARIKGFTLIPLSLYLEKGLAKIELAICKGKQLHDKRQTIKNRESSKEMKE